MPLPIVAVVGRPNVGKSTFVNRIAQADEAIVHEMRGVTRDRSYHEADWNGVDFKLIDTGGIEMGDDDAFQGSIRNQALAGANEADVILFLVEVNTGITDLDQMMADILRRTSKKVLLVCNKVDNYDLIYSSHEFYSLGLGEPYCISSMSGSGTGDLMDEIVRDLPPETKNEEEELPRITIVGRPNVGKSSLTNALLGEERNIVTPIAGTTRDAIHSRYNKYGLDFYLVDTAGMRKKGKVTEDLEFYSVMRSIRAIEESDVCILMLDAQQGLESQDLNIHNLIVRNRKGCVIVVNKWDLVEKGNNTMKEWKEALAKKTGALQRHSDHLHLGTQQTAHPRSAPDRHPGLRKPQAARGHLGAERLPAADHRELPAPGDQRQIHQNQIRDAAADTHAPVRLLRQSAPIYQGSLPPLPGE